MTPDSVRSPCVGICSLDDQDLCIGCQRTGREITLWTRMTNDERRIVLGQCELRARQQGLWLDSNRSGDKTS